MGFKPAKAVKPLVKSGRKLGGPGYLQTFSSSKGTSNTVGNFAGKINAENIPNMSKQEILASLPKDWKYTENNGFVHIRDANGNVRMKIDPPDKVTKYDHVHLFDESGNPIDVNLTLKPRNWI